MADGVRRALELGPDAARRARERILTGVPDGAPPRGHPAGRGRCARWLTSATWAPSCAAGAASARRCCSTSGALVYELHRQGRRAPELLQEKAIELGKVDREVRALEDALAASERDALPALRRAGRPAPARLPQLRRPHRPARARRSWGASRCPPSAAGARSLVAAIERPAARARPREPERGRRRRRRPGPAGERPPRRRRTAEQTSTRRGSAEAPAVVGGGEQEKQAHRDRRRRGVPGLAQGPRPRHTVVLVTSSDRAAALNVAKRGARAAGSRRACIRSDPYDLGTRPLDRLRRPLRHARGRAAPGRAASPSATRARTRS